MKANKDALRSARSLLRACRHADGSLDAEKARLAVAKVAEARPRGFLAILESLGRMVRLEVEKTRAVVESAAPLDDATRASVQADLRARYGPEINAAFQTVPDLVGGMRIRVGSDIWDGSVRTRLAKLQERLG